LGIKEKHKGCTRIRNEKDFGSRYFLQKAHVYTQIRILDDSLKSVLEYDECSLSLEDAAWLKWLPEKSIYN
jgi:hypothetical protein